MARAPASRPNRVSMRAMASSAQTVLPEPVGAPSSALSSESKSDLKACVWIGLKCVKRPSKSGASSAPTAATGSGCRSSSSVCGGYFSGRIRWRKEMGSTVSAPSHRSLTARMKYCGGSGSEMGTVKVSTCSSCAKRALSTKSSWCRMPSPSTSSTRMWNCSAPPCVRTSNSKSGVIVSSTRSTVRVIGCTCALSSSRGNWCTRR
mmetsp:Transcript_39769/g.98312  ORF Transcript_39769/g.98312 Transcript_39769/m.98312 type:complete len:205 (-) Transcript_39769:3824-4438(-)